MTKAGELAIDAVGDVTGWIFGNVASNLVTSVLDWVNSNSIRNRVNRLEVTAAILKENFDVFTQVSKGIIDNQEVLAMAVKKTADELNQLATDFPRFAWISSLLVNRIVTSGQHLQRVANEAKRGRVEVDSMAFLLGIPNLSYFDNRDTKFHSINRVSRDMVNFNFSINVEARDTKVYNVYGFGHWNNITGKPEYLEYRGARHLVYNETSNCMRAIEPPISTHVYETCEELDGEDPLLSSWETTKTTENLHRFENESHVQKFEDWNYIYCFPGKISVGTDFKNSARCPPDVFRLPTPVAFKTSRARHVPSRINRNMTFREHSIDNVNIGHFYDDSDTVNELKMFDKLAELRRELSHLKEVNFIVSKDTGFWWGSLTLCLSSAAGAIAYAICRFQFLRDCLTSCCFKWNSQQDPPRPGRPPTYPPQETTEPERPYEMRPLASSATPPARETPGRIYVELSRPAIIGLPVLTGGM